jgi:hypothetical protein
MKCLAIITILFLFYSCKGSNYSDDVPDSVKNQVDTVSRLYNTCFDGSALFKLWSSKIERFGDTNVYYFDLPCYIENSRHKIYPFPHRCLVLNDTLIDVQKLSIIIDQYESIYPPVYNPKNEKWWSDVDGYSVVDSIRSDQKYLSQQNDDLWIEYFVGNVELYYDRSLIECDSLIWDPHKKEIRIPGKAKFSQKKDSKISHIIGENWVLGVYEVWFRIEKPVGETVLLDSTLVGK